MRFVCVFLLPTLLILATPTAHAVNWYYLGENASGNKLSIDTDSIRKHNSGSFQYLSVWAKTDYTTAQKAYNNKLYRQEKSLFYIDCNNQKWQLAEAIGYDSQGGLIESYDFQNPGLVSTYSSASWDNIIPETSGYYIATDACYFANNR